MARRVNTKFVIGLGLTLSVGAVGALALFGIPWLHQRDPVYLEKRAEQAEKDGQGTIAIQYYQKAEQRALVKHMAGTDALCMKVGDLAMEMSAKETDFRKAAELYRLAMGSWQGAVTENPRFLPARERLTEQQYQVALLSRQPNAWATLESNADKLISLSPTEGNAYFYRAEARLELLRSGTSGANTPTETLAKIEEDLKKAVQVSPQDGRPVALLADIQIFTRAEQARAQDRTEAGEQAAQKYEAAGSELLTQFLKANPHNAEVTIELFRTLIKAQQQADQRMQKAEALQQKPEAEKQRALAVQLHDQAMKLLEEASAAKPTDLTLANALAGVLTYSDPARAEKILQETIAAAPTSTDQYVRLGDFYHATGKTQAAIESFKKFIDAPKTGGGLESLKTNDMEITSLYTISSLYMALAEADNPATKAGQADIAQASAYAEKYRTARADVAGQNILDGRLQLLRQNVSQALGYLKRADAVLGGASPSAGQGQRWLETKMLLVKAYEFRQEWGTAIGYLDQVRTYAPQNVLAILERATLLNRVSRYQEAEMSVKPLMDASMSPAARTQALRITAAAEYGMGNREEGDKIIASLDSLDAVLTLARAHYIRGESQAALQDLDRVFEKDPTNLGALNLAILANMQLERKDAANALLDKALAKYPDNANFQVMKATVNKPGGDQSQAQMQIINSITDPYSHSMALAQVYRKKGDRAKELESLQAAEKTLDDAPNGAQGALSEIVDRELDLLLASADAASSPADKEKYWSDARKYVQKAQRLNLDGADGRLYEGELQYRQGDRKGGMQTLQQVLADHPDYSRAQTMLAMMLGETGQTDAALDHFRQAIKQKPDDVPALKGAIRLLLLKGDSGSVQEARNDLDQAKRFSPGDADVISFADALDDPAEAIRVRDSMYRQDPGNVANVRSLAILYVRNKQPEKAIDLLRPLYDKNPDDLGLADTLARLYRETQRTNEGLVLYERFVGSSDPAIRFNAMMLLGEFYKSLGQNEQAIQTFHDASAVAPAGNDQADRRLADMYFDLEDMKHAEELYQKIYDKGGAKDVIVLRRIIEAEIRQDRFADAQNLLNNVIFKQDANDAEGLVLKGFLQMRQENMAAALSTFSAVLARDPNNLDALHYRAFAQFTLKKDLDQAVKDLLIVRDRNPNAITSRVLLARVYRQARRLSEASVEYADILKLRPDFMQERVEYAEFLFSLARIQQTLAPDNQSDLAYMVRSVAPMETLQALLTDSATRFPKEAAWTLMQGNLLTLRGQLADAQKVYAQAFAISGKSPQAAAAYMDSLLKSRNYEEVIDLANKIADLRPNDLDNLLMRGTAYAAAGKAAQATPDFRAAIDLAAQNVSAEVYVARRAAAALSGEGALALLQPKLVAAPDSIPLRMAVGQTQLAMNHFGDAVKTLSPLKDDAKAEPFQLMLLHLVALAEYQAKDLDNAATDYQKLLKRSPDDIEALNNISFLLAEDQKKPAEALPYAERAAKALTTLDPSVAFANNANVYDTLGWVRFLNQDTDGATRDLRRALQSEPLPIAYFHLAKVYQKTGHKDDAAKAVQGGLQIATDPKDPTAMQLDALKKELIQ